jgi:hypothetical protein
MPVGANVDAVVFRTLEKDRERRYQSAGEMKTQVEQAASEPAPIEPARPKFAPASAPRWVRPVAGKAQHFDTLKPWLMGEAPSMSQADAARQLGLSEGAVKVGIHRFRKRFRDTVRTEISQTLRDSSLVDEELRHLIASLS